MTLPGHDDQLDCPSHGADSSWLESAVKRFEQAWRQQPRPAIEDYLPAGDVRLPVLVELVHIDLELRLKAGEAVRVEEYFHRYPELAGHRGAALELIAGEFRLRQRGEPGLALAGFLERFPTYRRELPGQINQATVIVGDVPRRLADTLGQIPLEVAGYDILGVLGRGGMGVVYQARQRALHRAVALKMILTDEHARPSEVSRFRREAETLAQLQHPHIVQIYEVGEHHGRPFFAMEFVDGGSLDRQLAGVPQPARAAAQLVETLARTMHHAHQLGIIHRDLKPANILLQKSEIRNPESETRTAPSGSDFGFGISDFSPKVTDFGLAKLLRDEESGPTRSGDLLGTPSYMAPELLQGKTAPIGPATDVYGLGSILYEMLTGRPPFKAGTAVDTLLQVRFTEPVSPSRLQPKMPRDLVTICLRCLQKEPRQRYASALALAEDLGRFLDGRPIVARPAGVLARTIKWARRRPAVAALGAGICLILALGFAGVAWEWREAEKARRKAEAAHRMAEDRLYFNRIGLAHQAWRGYQVGHADRILEDCLPTSGQDDRRSWEWQYLRRLCRASVLTLTGHKHTVWGVTWSRDGRLLASCDGEWLVKEPGEVLVWDAATGNLLHTFRGHRYGVQNVAFSPDDRLLASAGMDGTVRLWDLTRPQDPAVVFEHPASVDNVAFSRNGDLLAAAGADNAVHIWDVPGRKLLHTYRKHPGNVFAVAFHPTKSLVASGCRGGGAVRLWHPATGADVRVLPWAASVRSVAFSADGKLLAAASYEGAVRVWDLGSWFAEPPTYHLYAGPVLSVAFSPNGRRLAWCTGTGRVQIIDPWTGEEVQTFRGHDGTVSSVAFNPDGRRLATAGSDHRVRVWDADAPQEVRSIIRQGGWSYDCAVSPDNKYVALAKGLSQSTDNQEKLVRLWDLGKSDWGKEFRWTDYLTSVAFGQNQLAAGSVGGTVVIWDIMTAAVCHELKGHRGVVTGVAYSPDGRQLVSAGADGTVRWWETATGQETHTVPGGGTPLSGVAYSPSGHLVAAAGKDPTVRVWDAATAREVYALRGHAAPVSYVAFSPNGQWLASVDLDRVVRLWDVHTGRESTPPDEPIRLDGPALEEKRMPWDPVRPLVPRLAFSADSRRLASINGQQPVQLWDVVTRLPALSLPVPEPAFQCLAFSRDGRWLVAAAGVWLHVWDAGPSEVAPGPDRR